jgi:polyisoprenoid-binding protein YceI
MSRNKLNRFSNLAIFLMMAFWAMGMSQSYGAGLVAFGTKEAKINGSIKYSVLGRYNAHFDNFKGEIKVDEQSNKIESVYLEIETASIQSDCKWCDKIVLSDKLLAARKYPKIIFKSSELIPNGTNYTVRGVLDLHGVKKQINFPFQVQINSTEKMFNAQGRWSIRRKDFKITWNKVLDQGN